MLCINAYFTHVHNSNPLVNEDLFRSKYLSGPHSDSTWIALLNMVLTMGSIAASDASNHAHFAFYRRAYPHMKLESPRGRPPGNRAGSCNPRWKLSKLSGQAESCQRDHWSGFANGSSFGT